MGLGLGYVVGVSPKRRRQWGLGGLFGLIDNFDQDFVAGLPGRGPGGVVAGVGADGLRRDAVAG